MTPRETKAMIDAWNKWHEGTHPELIPSVSIAFKKGFEAALAMQKNPECKYFDELFADAERWRCFAASPQTALMLGSNLDPNSDQDWIMECNRLVKK